MSPENPNLKRNVENPKKSDEFLKWKNGVVNNLKAKGLDITSDEEFFILTIKDRQENPRQIHVQAWEKIPVLKDQQSKTPDMIPVEDVLEADALYFSKNPDSHDEWISRKALDNFYQHKKDQEK